MLLLISDANILIDMDVGDLLAPMFSMEYRFAVPDVLYVEELEGQHDGLLYLGLESMTLGSDKDLRAAAEAEGVQVRGTLWLVTEMVRTGKISTTVARAAYQRMRDSGRRLPWDLAGQMLDHVSEEKPKLVQ